MNAVSKRVFFFKEDSAKSSDCFTCTVLCNVLPMYHFDYEQQPLSFYFLSEIWCIEISGPKCITVTGDMFVEKLLLTLAEYETKRIHSSHLPLN